MAGGRRKRGADMRSAWRATGTRQDSVIVDVSTPATMKAGSVVATLQQP